MGRVPTKTGKTGKSTGKAQEKKIKLSKSIAYENLQKFLTENNPKEGIFSVQASNNDAREAIKNFAQEIGLGRSRKAITKNNGLFILDCTDQGIFFN